MQEEKYNDKNMKMVGLVAFIGIFIFLSVDVVMLIEEIFDIHYLSRLIPQVESVILYLWLGRWLFLPIIVIGCWYMYFERYEYLKLFEEEKSVYKGKRKRLLIRMGAEVLTGAVALGSVHGFLMFLVKHWEYIDELVSEAVIKGILVVVWVFLWFVCQKKRKEDISIQGMGIYKSVGVIMLLMLVIWISIVGTAKVNKETEWIEFKKMLEYYEQYGEYMY